MGAQRLRGTNLLVYSARAALPMRSPIRSMFASHGVLCVVWTRAATAPMVQPPCRLASCSPPPEGLRTTIPLYHYTTLLIYHFTNILVYPSRRASCSPPPAGLCTTTPLYYSATSESTTPPSISVSDLQRARCGLDLDLHALPCTPMHCAAATPTHSHGPTPMQTAEPLSTQYSSTQCTRPLPCTLSNIL